MMKQMKIKINNYNYEYPVWLWIEKPVLRKRGYIEKGTEGVLVEVEIDTSSVLISDFMAWHSVLNDEFIVMSAEEEIMFENELINVLKEKNWERIFCIEELRNNEFWKGKQLLQAVKEFIDR